MPSAHDDDEMIFVKDDISYELITEMDNGFYSDPNTRITGKFGREKRQVVPIYVKCSLQNYSSNIQIRCSYAASLDTYVGDDDFIEETNLAEPLTIGYI